jgi:hypothetical protein
VIAVHRYLLVRLYLSWHAAASIGFGLEMLLAPARLISSPAMATVYGLAPPWEWGLLFEALAVICATGARWPLQAWRPAIFALALAQVCWASALLAPLILHHPTTNILAATPWIALAVTSTLIAWHTIREERHPDVGRT